MDFAVGRGSAELNWRPHARPKAGCTDGQSFTLPRRYSGCDFVGRQRAISHHPGRQERVGGRKTAGAVCRTRLALPPQLKNGFRSRAVKKEVAAQKVALDQSR